MVDYLSVAAWLRNRIETGELPPGERVPGCAELMRLFGVGEHTARRALRELKGENLIVTEPGRGTFSRETRPVERLVLGESAPGLPFWPASKDRGTKVFYSHAFKLTATVDVADALGIRPGSPVQVRRIYYATPRREIQLAVSYRPVDLIDEVEPVRFRDELRVRLADVVERDRMELTIAAPVIEIARTSYAASDQAVELLHTVMDANAYLLEYHHPAVDVQAGRGGSTSSMPIAITPSASRSGG